MRKLIFLALSILFLSSCYTSNKALKQLNKAFVTYPTETKDWAASVMPVQTKTTTIERYIQGKDSIIVDTIEVDCEPVINEVEKIVKVSVPKKVYRVDTFTKFKTDTIVDTRMVESLEGQKLDLERKTIKQEVKIDTLTKWLWILGAVLFFVVVVIVLLSYLKIKI